MTLDEFREATKTLDGSRRLVVRGYEGGVDDVSEIKSVQIRVGYWNNMGYYGKHEVIDDPNWDHTAPDKYGNNEPALPIDDALWLHK
jgi:hypothetical protein